MKLAPDAGAVIDTEGGGFGVGDDADELNVTVRVADVVDAPPLSVATAFNVYVPAATVGHDTLYGLEVSVPIRVEPA